ncbi:MAG: hypothetical protein IT497_09460 [Ottowia sp.]|nr:hypothetical protein [Ottowia sp.]
MVFLLVIALHGTIKSIRDGKYGLSKVLNLEKYKCLVDSADANNGIGYEASVWTKDTDCFSNLKEGMEIVVLGLWNASIGKPLPAKKEGKFQTFTNHKLNLNIGLKAQIVLVPKEQP